MSFFDDRHDAGTKLAAVLRQQGFKHPVILAIPRGGVEIAAAIAKATRWPWSVILTRKLRTPSRPELAFGAVSKTGEPWLNSDVIKLYSIDQATIAAEVARQRQECARREEALRPLFHPVTIPGNTVIVVDDGVATGATMIAALQLVKKTGASKVVCATPVCPDEMRAILLQHCDQLVTLRHPAWFSAVGEFYASFPQLNDRDVELLASKNFRVPQPQSDGYHRPRSTQQKPGKTEP